MLLLELVVGGPDMTPNRAKDKLLFNQGSDIVAPNLATASLLDTSWSCVGEFSVRSEG
jgi:hypothetical protein